MRNKLLTFIPLYIYAIIVSGCAYTQQPSSLKEEQTAEDNQISFAWYLPNSITSEREDELKQVLFNAFFKAYEPFTQELLKINFPSKEAWLKATFDEELQEFKEQKTPIKLLVAKHGNQIIGAATIEPDQQIPNAIYIRQMGIDPQYWRQGIGKQMISLIEKEHPHINSLVLVARVVNIKADKFYQDLGFKKGTYQHPDYNPMNYVGYKRTY